MSNTSTRDELFSGNFGNASSSLLRMAGGFGNIGGPGMFMIRCITSGTLTSIFTGMTGAILSAMVYGTAGLPFIISACAGFIIGTVGFYRDAVRKSLLYLDRYPRLLQLHLDANFPHEGFDRWSREALRSSNFRSWQLRSMLTVAWLSAVPALENITEVEEQKRIQAEADVLQISSEKLAYS